MTRLRRTARLLAGLAAGSLLLSGCDFDVYDLPLPGGTNVGDDPIEVKVMFADVLDLVPKSTVKVNDVSVGKVTDIRLEGYTAEVTLELRNDTELPDNAVAELRQTSLLGEKFVSLAAPASGATGQLADGDIIDLEDTGRNPEVEEVLGALSLLLNGGGVAQLKTIASELNLALEGREDAARSVLTQIDTFVGTLDAGKADIVAAIESLDRLAKTAQTQQDTIDAALDEIPSALVAIDQQRADLVKMLQSINELSDVGVRVIQASKENTIATFEQLQPVLTEFANSGDSFVKAFHVFLTYPFVDEVVGRDPQVARNLHMGDYTNLSIQMEVDLSSGINLPGLPVDLPEECKELDQLPDQLPSDPVALEQLLEELCDAAANQVARCYRDLQDGSLDTRACLGLLDNLPDRIVDALCTNSPLGGLPLCGEEGGNPIPDVPGLPELPGLPGTGGAGDGGVLGGVGGALNRPATGSDRPTGGPTMGQLMKTYDQGLVSLLVPGMVTR